MPVARRMSVVRCVGPLRFWQPSSQSSAHAIGDDSNLGADGHTDNRRWVVEPAVEAKDSDSHEVTLGPLVPTESAGHCVP